MEWQADLAQTNQKKAHVNVMVPSKLLEPHTTTDIETIVVIVWQSMLLYQGDLRESEWKLPTENEVAGGEVVKGGHFFFNLASYPGS